MMVHTFILTKDRIHRLCALMLAGMIPEHIDTLEWWEESELRELDGGDNGCGACLSVGSTSARRARRASSAQFARTILPLIQVLRLGLSRADLIPHLSFSGTYRGLHRGRDRDAVATHLYHHHHKVDE